MVGFTGEEGAGGEPVEACKTRRYGGDLLEAAAFTLAASAIEAAPVALEK